MSAASRPAVDGLRRLFKRVCFLPAFPLRRRHCIGWLLALTLVAAGAGHWAGAARQEPGAGPAVDALNAERVRVRVQPVQRDPRLDRLAEQYLAMILASRDLSVAAHRAARTPSLYHDVAAALGDGGMAYRYTGITAGYGVDPRQAVAAALGEEANRPAMTDPVYQIAGVATGVVPSGPLWLMPPAGGVGRDVDLNGQTIVVIVMAGSYRG